MCIVLPAPGDNPIAVNKYIKKIELRLCYHMKSQECLRSEVLTFVTVQRIVFGI